MTSKEKVAALREEMRANHIDAFVVFSADPHMSEYLPSEWKERSWLTGFTGSAGFAVVTLEQAGLWTDGRYFIQAPKELKGSDFELMKMGVDGVPDYISWMLSQIQPGGTVAVNAIATANSNWEEMRIRLSEKNIKLVDLPLLKNLWTERGKSEVKNPIFVHPLERAGQSVQDKLKAIREKMAAQQASLHVISSLDDVAWTLNLRGSDVECNPVFLGYIVISTEEAVLFVDQEKLNAEAQQHLKEAGVLVKDYDTFFDYLKAQKNERVLLSPNSNQSVFFALEDNTILHGAVPGNLMKAVKNETELEGFRKVMVRDGVAMVKFLYWLKHNVGKIPMTEYSIGLELEKFRREGENFVGVSFGSIVGYNGNDAIPHYSADKENSEPVTNKGSILVDSGGQYLEGTTDITRTFPVGEVSEQYRHDSTKVLQGMIRLSMVKFPKGTKGVHLDAIARLPLWMEGKEFNHGVGHGVGSFMNVHEGPQNIRKDLNPQDLIPGMVLSNEPGLYLENQYGIRHENLVAVKPYKTTDFAEFYEFETLTICPFFREAIVKEILSEEEIQWLNQYHQWVKEKLEPHLEGEVKEWFLQLVQPL
ncbi:aminopeptidase P family protein [Bergeyella sp. RCAD1439]|uniref:aminopeptidase P family protein n=1 Tax=Bergeyella anatis TaxID=3113737 RepID=UPI002E19EAD9|nr:aminopeptidase P family protein [Bergeyella sp. RCAD1439]